MICIDVLYPHHLTDDSQQYTVDNMSATPVSITFNIGTIVGIKDVLMDGGLKIIQSV